MEPPRSQPLLESVERMPVLFLPAGGTCFGFLSAFFLRLYPDSWHPKMTKNLPMTNFFFSFLFGPHLPPLLHCKSEPCDALWMPEGSPSHIHLQSSESRPTSCMPCQHFTPPLQKIKIKPIVFKVRLTGNPTSSQIWCSG